MDDGYEIFVETCSYIGQCVVKVFMDDIFFFNEETLFNGQMLLEKLTFIWTIDNKSECEFNLDHVALL